MLDQPDQFALGVVDLFLQVSNLVGCYDQRVSVSCHDNTLTRPPGFAQHTCCAWLGICGSMALVNGKSPDQGVHCNVSPGQGLEQDGGPSALIVARRGASARPEVINMPEKQAYAPSRARRQAQAALTRGRRAKKASPAAEIPGQMSIEDVLAEIAAEQAAEGGEQS